MLTHKGNGFRMHARSVFRRIFHVLLDRLGIRRFREHSFFAALLTRPAAIADFGAQRGEFFAALKAEYKSMPAVRRTGFRWRMALANALFIIRRTIFGSGYS
jgi:hypothetical protein